MTKRKHKNTTRLTAKERARAFVGQFEWSRCNSTDRIEKAVEEALQLHARQALARHKRKARDAR